MFGEIGAVRGGGREDVKRRISSSSYRYPGNKYVRLFLRFSRFVSEPAHTVTIFDGNYVTTLDSGLGRSVRITVRALSVFSVFGKWRSRRV